MTKTLLILNTERELPPINLYNIKLYIPLLVNNRKMATALIFVTLPLLMGGFTTSLVTCFATSTLLLVEGHPFTTLDTFYLHNNEKNLPVTGEFNLNWCIHVYNLTVLHLKLVPRSLTECFIECSIECNLSMPTSGANKTKKNNSEGDGDDKAIFTANLLNAFCDPDVKKAFTDMMSAGIKSEIKSANKAITSKLDSIAETLDENVQTCLENNSVVVKSVASLETRINDLEGKIN